MDGTLAMIFGIIGLGQLETDTCPTGCFARSDAQARAAFQVANTVFNGTLVGSEIGVSYDFDHRYGPVQPTVSASYSDLGETWLGGGAKLRVDDPDSGFFVESALQIGYHDIADGPNIGGNFHFRSDVGLGFEFDNGAALILTYDHRSNGGIKLPNPGLETIILEYAIPLN